jgi:hypothetical protein
MITNGFPGITCQRGINIEDNKGGNASHQKIFNGGECMINMKV